MSHPEPKSKPNDPDPLPSESEVRKRDMPGNPHGPDHPEKPRDATDDEVSKA